MFAGAAAMVTAKYSLPIQLVSSLIAFFAATKVTDKWKKEIIHPAVEGYKGVMIRALAQPHVDPEFQAALATLEHEGASDEEYHSAINTVISTAFPTAKEYHEALVACDGDYHAVFDLAITTVTAKALEENKFYTEFLNKPFVEQKWFVKVKDYVKNFVDSMKDFPKIMAIVMPFNLLFMAICDHFMNKEVTANA